MRLISTDSLKPGDRLGKTIYNEKGATLLQEGALINERLIMRLLQLNVAFVYIEDPKTDHIKSSPSISAKLRKEAAETIENTFKDIQKEEVITSSFVVEKAARKFKDIINHILDELKGNEELLTLLSDVYAYDNYIFTHSLNVTLYSLAIGMELKLNQKQLETLGMGAILHDVGKMRVPASILMKPGKLTAEEFEEIKKHSEYGFRLLKDVPAMSLLVAHCALQHHERIDGSGYPRRLLGTDIHPFGKIIAVADVFDAVTSNRIYRNAMLPNEGLEILYAGAGTQFELEVIVAFRNSVAIYPNGLTVKLNDGRIGIVSKQNCGLSDRPIIDVLEQDGVNLDVPYEVDLKEHMDITITGCLTRLNDQ